MRIADLVAQLDALPRDADPETDFLAGCQLLLQYSAYRQWKTDHDQLRDAYEALQRRILETQSLIDSGTRRKQEIDECKARLLEAWDAARSIKPFYKMSRIVLENSDVLLRCRELAKKTQNGPGRLSEMIYDETVEMAERYE